MTGFRLRPPDPMLDVRLCCHACGAVQPIRLAVDPEGDGFLDPDGLINGWRNAHRQPHARIE